MKKKLFAIVTSLVLAASLAVPCFADFEYDEIKAVVPITVKGDGIDETFEITITDTKTQETKTVRVKSGQTADFSIVFDTPEMKEFKVKEVPGSNTKVEYDDCVYSLFMSAMDEDGVLKPVVVAQKNAAPDKPEVITFENKVEPTPTPSSPSSSTADKDGGGSSTKIDGSDSSKKNEKGTEIDSNKIPLSERIATGDYAPIVGLISTAVIALLLLILLIVKLKERKDEKKEAAAKQEPAEQEEPKNEE